MNKKRLSVKIGNILLGGGAPVVVQSMTNTETSNVKESVAQCLELFQAGSELIRLTVNNSESAKAIPKIKEALEKANCPVPLIGDFHYNGHTLLKNEPACAKALSKLRINPGNVGFGQKKDAQFQEMIEIACRYEKAVRIGVNGGSLDPVVLQKIMDENQKKKEPLSPKAIWREAMIASALDSAAFAHSVGLPKNYIVLSCKVSSAPDLIAIYRALNQRADYPLHLGLTEAGIGLKGAVCSTAALAVLLEEGIGDTIRVSLTPSPNSPRTEEVRVAQEILQSLELRSFHPTVIACPGCGRTTSKQFQELAEEVSLFVREKMPEWKRQFQGVENLKVAVMGCIVNGPGESKHAHIGISLPGTGENFSAPVFEDGVKVATLKSEGIQEAFLKRIEAYIENHYTSIPR